MAGDPPCFRKAVTLAFSREHLLACCIALLLFRYMVFGNVMSGLEVLKSLEQFGDWTGTVKVRAETILVGIMPLRVACIRLPRSAAAFM